MSNLRNGNGIFPEVDSQYESAKLFYLNEVTGKTYRSTTVFGALKQEKHSNTRNSQEATEKRKN